MSKTSLNGEIVMYNYKKGYGFIHSELGDDIFFHVSKINFKEEDKKKIEIHQKVTFSIEKTDRGNMAVNIVLVK